MCDVMTAAWPPPWLSVWVGGRVIFVLAARNVERHPHLAWVSLAESLSHLNGKPVVGMCDQNDTVTLPLCQEVDFRVRGE